MCSKVKRFDLRAEDSSEVSSNIYPSRKLAAIALVAAGYGGDMDEDLANELLDDIDFHFNKVKCRQIEQMMPRLMELVQSEMKVMRY